MKKKEGEIRESYAAEYGVELVQIRLPAPLKRRLHQFAVLHHRSMTDVVQEAVEHLLRQPTSPPKSTGLCGSWSDDRTAEEIIRDIKSHRGPLIHRK